ncbi:tigger transposable element-derived protein 6-like [Haliotis asinina]|uniref:tigger transposable element-derived protein 6-like n=1 Tax=Haliotis asinina TaxID=109174 RepID=UPI00353199C1
MAIIGKRGCAIPPNTTSRIQPMDQGIIASLKSNYRKQMMTDLICAYDKMEEYEVTLLSAITNIHRAWCHVTSQCIVNCFRKGGFKLPDENDMDHSELDEDGIPLANLRGMWGEVTDIANVPAEVTLEDFLNADENIVTTERLTDEDIVMSVKKDNETVDSDEDDSETVAEMEVKTTTEAATCLKHVRGDSGAEVAWCGVTAHGPGLQFQQDNARSHTAKFPSKRWHERH